MSDLLKKIEIHVTLLDVTFDEWDYVKDALGTLLTMGVLTKSDITLERGSDGGEAHDRT